jgi:hypothetical protein
MTTQLDYGIWQWVLLSGLLRVIRVQSLLWPFHAMACWRPAPMIGLSGSGTRPPVLYGRLLKAIPEQFALWISRPMAA